MTPTVQRTRYRVAPRWNFQQYDKRVLEDFARVLGVGLPAARVLWNRGFREPSQARNFLTPTLELLHDPFLLLGMNRAVARLLQALERKEKILVYGDYDVDGTSSVVILKKALDLAGGDVEFKVPHRLREGYGMRPEALEEAAARGITLVISVDTGIRAADVVRAATVLGVDMIITDHHLPDEDIPPAVAVLNPNQVNCPYPEKNLCGAGVTFKLIQALLSKLQWPEAKSRKLMESFLKIVAIATVADVVPLTGENRAIVKLGLSGLDYVKNPGLRALLDVAGFNEGKAPSAGQVAFRVAPRINAAGRMANATDVIDMFLTDDPARARDLAAQLHDLNAERQQTEQDIVQEVLMLCDEMQISDEHFALVFSKAGWHRGVIGIVASRIVERYHRPVFILGEEDGKAQGSGRSIRPFHLLNALESMPELFEKFGGHKQAAGVTMPADQVEEFRKRLNAYAANCLTPDDLRPVLEIDAVLSLKEIDDAAVADVFQIAPFGFGNPCPIFAAQNVEVIAPPQIVKDRHMRIRVRQDNRFLSIMGWNMADCANTVQQGSLVDVAFTLEDDEFSASRGYSPWQAILKDVKSSVQ
ncbi:single-stranded-DNA-specific exonuclease RecJ [Bryobacterales bacterium F-183]|nr:single-stranded-DNA-specific exonuclease RecJ [Bryobacterales bacterium F-183]